MAAVPSSQRNRAKIRKFFDEADVDRSGYLSLEEFSKSLKAQGYKMSRLEIKKQFARFDLDRDNRISRDEFMACMGELPDHVHESATIRKMFQAYDRNGDGVIDRKELTEVISGLGGNKREIDKMMDALDTNRNGKIEYEEFVAFFAKCAGQTHPV